jgi:hypothetical protein
MSSSMKKMASALLLTFVLIGCGTIMQGTTQEVGISSNPSSAKVSINGRDLGSTPIVADLKRKDTHTIKVELEGYQPYEITLTRKTSGWVWGNLVLGGLVGLVIDAVKGGMYNLTPDQVMAEMRDTKSAQVKLEDGVYLNIVLVPNPQWEKIGQLSRD